MTKTRRQSASVDRATVRPQRTSWLVWTGTLTVLASLFSLLLLILFAQIPNMVYILAAIPFQRPYVDLLWWQFAILSLPYISLSLAVVIALMTSLHVRSQKEGRAICLYYLVVALALLSFHLVILL